MGCINISQYDPNIHEIISVHNTEAQCNEECGVCCVNGVCIDNNQTDCANANGIWYSGVTCEDVICPNPSPSPSQLPSVNPSQNPSPLPSVNPSQNPSQLPSVNPSPQVGLGACCAPQCDTDLDLTQFDPLNPLFPFPYSLVAVGNKYVSYDGEEVSGWGEAFVEAGSPTYTQRFTHIFRRKYDLNDLLNAPIGYTSVIAALNPATLPNLVDLNHDCQWSGIYDLAEEVPGGNFDIWYCVGRYLQYIHMTTEVMVYPPVPGGPIGNPLNTGFPSATNPYYIIQLRRIATIQLRSPDGSSIVFNRTKVTNKYYECIDNSFIDKTQEAYGGLPFPYENVGGMPIDPEGDGQEYSYGAYAFGCTQLDLQNNPQAMEIAQIFIELLKQAPFDCISWSSFSASASTIYGCIDNTTQQECLQKEGIWYSGLTCQDVICNPSPSPSPSPSLLPGVCCVPSCTFDYNSYADTIDPNTITDLRSSVYYDTYNGVGGVGSIPGVGLYSYNDDGLGNITLSYEMIYSFSGIGTADFLQVDEYGNPIGASANGLVLVHDTCNFSITTSTTSGALEGAWLSWWDDTYSSGTVGTYVERLYDVSRIKSLKYYECSPEGYLVSKQDKLFPIVGTALLYPYTTDPSWPLYNFPNTDGCVNSSGILQSECAAAIDAITFQSGLQYPTMQATGQFQTKLWIPPDVDPSSPGYSEQSNFIMIDSITSGPGSISHSLQDPTELFKECLDTITESACVEGGVYSSPGIALGTWHSGENCATFDCNNT